MWDDADFGNCGDNDNDVDNFDDADFGAAVADHTADSDDRDGDGRTDIIKLY